MAKFYDVQAKAYDATRESMLVARPYMMSTFGPIKKGHAWLDIGGATGRNLHFLQMQLDLFDRIVIIDVVEQLLAKGKANAEATFGKLIADRITWVCCDFTDEKAVQKALGDAKFDNVTFSYSLSMIPAWERALDRAKARCTEGGRVLVADFLLRNWYMQDGVRITASHRDEISERFPHAYF